MSLLTVKQYMGPTGGSRDVILSREHVVSVTPSSAFPGYQDVHMQPTQGGPAFFTVSDEDAARILEAS